VSGCKKHRNSVVMEKRDKCQSISFVRKWDNSNWKFFSCSEVDQTRQSVVQEPKRVFHCLFVSIQSQIDLVFFMGLQNFDCVMTALTPVMHGFTECLLMHDTITSKRVIFVVMFIHENR